LTATVVAVGEALWDTFPDGQRPGGAPANVAYHVSQLGRRAAVVSRVGDDPRGREWLAYLGGRGVEVGWVQRDPKRPTDSVGVTLEGGEPRYTISAEAPWDHLEVDPSVLALVDSAAALCVGSLAQRSPRSRLTIQTLIGRASRRAMVVFDVNLRPPFVSAPVIEATLRAARVVKMNEAEVVALSALLARPKLVPWLVDEVGVGLVVVTRGGEGARGFTPGWMFDAPGPAIDVSKGDPVGAGDAFTAALIHHLLESRSPQEAVRGANRYAGLVASRRGAMPPLSADDLATVGC
jgi:fructokinase